MFRNPKYRNGNKVLCENDYRWLMKCGIMRVEDFFDSDGRLLSTREALNRGLPPAAVLEWSRVCKVLKEIPGTFCGRFRRLHKLTEEERIEEVLRVRIGGDLFSIMDLTQGKVLKSVARQRMAKPTPHQLRLQDALQFEEDKWQLKYKYVKKQEFIS